jgi:hypothetical protein
MPFDIPDLDCFMELFDNNARLNGFNGIYWVVDNTPATHLNKDKFDCIVSSTIYFKAKVSTPRKLHQGTVDKKI